ncbi:cytokinin dehydrogenase 6-like [Dendrobium catenatum]|uniref:cytokinin dehydrogenase 6-like n=1 Tax=Dendrobium catenatum TaxID=906689 RepID=UPI00109EE3D9|nr:cytokinin dehydrogenase 6-like [Dendrobium catenatum]
MIPIAPFNFLHYLIINHSLIMVWCCVGKGEMLTCSEDLNQDLFHGVLGGLGQFGVITRARIALEPAPTMVILLVRWVALAYSDFSKFASSEEYLISLDGMKESKKGFDYIEGFFFSNSSHVENFISPFLSVEDREIAGALADQNAGIYLIEAAFHYNESSASTVDQEIETIISGVINGLQVKFTRDLPYTTFIDRVRREEQKLRRHNLWNLHHPWLNLIVPKSKINIFNEKLFKGIFQEEKPLGVYLVYPMNRNKYNLTIKKYCCRWDERWSLMFPEEEEIIYKIGLLITADANDVERVLGRIKEIRSFCNENGNGTKEYTPCYKTTEEWKRYFGSKWERLVKLKKKYDPKAILTPGQMIFTSSLLD